MLTRIRSLHLLHRRMGTRKQRSSRPRPTSIESSLRRVSRFGWTEASQLHIFSLILRSLYTPLEATFLDILIFFPPQLHQGDEGGFKRGRKAGFHRQNALSPLLHASSREKNHSFALKAKNSFAQTLSFKSLLCKKEKTKKPNTFFGNFFRGNVCDAHDSNAVFCISV